MLALAWSSDTALFAYLRHLRYPLFPCRRRRHSDGRFNQQTTLKTSLKLSRQLPNGAKRQRNVSVSPSVSHHDSNHNAPRLLLCLFVQNADVLLPSTVCSPMPFWIVYMYVVRYREYIHYNGLQLSSFVQFKEVLMKTKNSFLDWF